MRKVAEMPGAKEPTLAESFVVPRRLASRHLPFVGSTGAAGCIEALEEFCLEAVPHEDGMNRLLLVVVGGLVTITAVAQTPSTPKSGTDPANSAPTSTAPATTTGTGATGSSSAAPNSQPAAPATAQPGTTIPADQPQQPTTEMLPQGDALPSADPVLATKELPKSDLSLIGGTALKVDKIRNKVDLQPFGGGKKVKVTFDDRSHIYRDGRETTVTGINKGDRIYVDTMLVNGQIFARNLRVVTKSGPAESRGQVTAFDPRSGRVNLQDSLTGQTVSFDVTKQTAMQRRGSPATPADIKPGTLLEVMFAPGRHGGTADQISILAVPGEDFVFAGHVTNLDLSRGVLALDNESDDKNYEVHFNPATLEERNALKVGSEVTARATFDGQSYHANQVTVMQPASAQQ